MSYLVHILSNINFQELKRYVFIVFLKQFVVIAHLSSFGKLFHRIAAPVSIRRLPYRTDLYLFGVIDVVLADLKGRFGWYQFSKSDMYLGASFLRDLYVNTNILNWQRFTTGNQCKSRSTGVI